jgi:hypothetical protein
LLIYLTAEADDGPTEDGTAGVTRSRGSHRNTSAVWKEFTRVCDDDGVWKAKCNYCGKKLSATTRNGTNHLRNHLKICIYKKKSGDKVQTNLRFAATEKGQVAVENYVFDQDTARKALCTMITQHEYPLSIVDHLGFRQFVSALQPLFKIGTRNTIRKGILNGYDVEKRKARMFLQKLSCRVAITTDLWTADKKKGYMAVTGHFIDDSWTLRSCILRLFPLLSYFYLLLYFFICCHFEVIFCFPNFISSCTYSFSVILRLFLSVLIFSSCTYSFSVILRLFLVVLILFSVILVQVCVCSMPPYG